MAGRPTVMTPEIEDRIISLISTSSNGIKKICSENDGLPHHDTIRAHIVRSKDFSDRYARAKEEQADVLADEMIEIADDCTDDVTLLAAAMGEDGREVINHSAINRARLQIDTRKWIAAKLKPKKYGEKVDHNHSGGIAINWNEEKTYEAEPEAD